MQTQVCVLIVVFVYVMHVFDVLAFSSYLYGCVRVCARMCGCVRERECVCVCGVCAWACGLTCARMRGSEGKLGNGFAFHVVMRFMFFLHQVCTQYAYDIQRARDGNARIQLP